MHLDLAVAGLVVGLLVGFIGMGGGALLTPLLVLFFQVAPLAAISSDLLTSLVMMPVGAAVHLRYRTVNWRLVRWLTVGSVPAAFAGAVIIGSLGHAPGRAGRPEAGHRHRPVRFSGDDSAPAGARPPGQPAR